MFISLYLKGKDLCFNEMQRKYVLSNTSAECWQLYVGNVNMAIVLKCKVT